jgi:hypothetical protein
MLDTITDEHENEHRQIVYRDDSRTPAQQRSWNRSGPAVHEKGARPLPWRWTILIITTLSTLAWIGILFAVIAVLNSL